MAQPPVLVKFNPDGSLYSWFVPDNLEQLDDPCHKTRPPRAGERGPQPITGVRLARDSYDALSGRIPTILNLTAAVIDDLEKDHPGEAVAVGARLRFAVASAKWSGMVLDKATADAWEAEITAMEADGRLSSEDAADERLRLPQLRGEIVDEAELF